MSPPASNAKRGVSSSARAGSKTRSDAIAPGAPPVTPSPSASLVLLAPLQQRSADGYDYRVLLLKREARASTFFSAHVFPGGNLDPIDSDSAAWTGFFPSEAELSAEQAKEQAVKLCAVRETFEECGILLLEGGGSKGRERWAAMAEPQRKLWRDKVHDDGKNFVKLLDTLNEGEESSAQKLRPGLSSLQYRAKWITPANMKRRYDTSFFLTILPPASSPSPTPSASGSTTPTHQDHVATADNGETISADWLTPLEAISRTLAHTSSLQSCTGPPPESIILFPPQFYLLAELVKAKSWKDLVDPRLQDLGGNPLVHARPIRAFEPEIQRVVDSTGASRAATVLYGDPEHSATDRSQSRAEDRHRTYILMRVEPKDKDEDEKWKKSPPLGLTVMGVERKGMGRLLGDGWEDMSEGDVGSGERAKL